MPLNLQIYLDWLVDECFRKQETPKYLVTGAFHSIFNFFMTPAIFNYDSRDSVAFLQQIETCMQQRPAQNQGPRDVPELVPVSHILQGMNCMLFYVRGLVSKERQDLEVELCENSMDALKVFPLLSRSSVLRLARDMIRCVLVPLSGYGHKIDGFDEDYLRDLVWEVEKSWNSRFCV